MKKEKICSHLFWYLGGNQYDIEITWARKAKIRRDLYGTKNRNGTAISIRYLQMMNPSLGIRNECYNKLINELMKEKWMDEFVNHSIN